jgi:F-type H+-transporting ATPase subunit a
MMLGALLALLLLQPVPAEETPHPAPAHATASPEAPLPGVGGEHGAAAAETHGTQPSATDGIATGHGAAPTHGGGGHGMDPASILMHHVVDIRLGHLYAGGVDLGPTKHLLFFMGAALFVIILVRASMMGYKAGVPTGPAAAIETLVVYIRDEVAEKNIGHHDAHRFVPLLLSLFFFILFAALLGLLPFSATATGNISVTMGLAFITFLVSQWIGISKYGVVHHFQNMVPPGLPAWLLPVMIPVEILGMFSRPFALMVRLFANMLAGHMMITTLLMLIPLAAAVSTGMGVFMIPISLGLALFIMILEVLVAFIQAYIFTLLTSIFIGMSAHPSH